MNTSSERAVLKRDLSRISPLLRLALLLGILVHLAGFFIFRVVTSPLPAREDSPAFIAYIFDSDAGDEFDQIGQANLFDSAPLFIPTEWTSVSKVYNFRDEQDWRVFPDFEPGIDLEREMRPVRLSLPFIESVNKPVDLLDFRFWDLFSYLGQGDLPPAKSTTWQSVAVVKVLEGNEQQRADVEIVLEMDLSASSSMPRPVVIYLNMAAPGMPDGPPLVESSSGSEEVDQQVLDWLARPSTLARLPAGFLELRVFP